MERKRIIYMAELAILAAILLLMAVTPIGYLHVGAIEITFNTIPVILGAVVMGPAAGGILGGIFGITSFIQCFGISAFGTLMLGINPVFTFIVCFIPRVLIGVLSGLIFKAFKNKNLLSFVVTAVSGALINTLLFVGGIILLFGATAEIQAMINDMGGGNILLFFVAFVGLNGLIEAASCALIGTAVSKAVYVFNSKMRS